MGDVIFPVGAQTALADDVKASLAAGLVRLFQQTLADPTQDTTRAQLLANEATFSGYTAGGYEVAAFNGPLNDPTSGAVLLSPPVIPTMAVADPLVGNVITGFWYEVGTQVYAIGTFPSPQAMAAPGDNIPMMFRLKLFANPVG